MKRLHSFIKDGSKPTSKVSRKFRRSEGNREKRKRPAGDPISRERRQVRPLRRVLLAEWEEYVGWLEGVEEGPEGLVAVFDHTAVALPGEVDGLRQLVGKKVGILRTDDAERPIRVRAIPDL